MEATTIRSSADKRIEADWITKSQGPLWDRINAVAGARMGIEFRVPRFTIEDRESDALKLLVGFKVRRAEKISPYQDVPGQVANVLRGIAAEYEVIANRIEAIPPGEMESK